MSADGGQMRVQNLFIYPLKSAKGLELTEATMTSTGFEYDRQWVVTKKSRKGAENQHMMVTGRQYPKLLTVTPAPSTEGLALSAPGVEDINVPVVESKPFMINIWGEDALGHDQGDAAAAWVQGYLGAKDDLRLMHFPRKEGFKRKLEAYYMGDTEAEGGYALYPGFADGMPYLIVTQEALDKMNADMKEATEGKAGAGAELPLEMVRFRPNIVIAGGGEPFGEQKWKEITIGEARFRLFKSCVRCKMTTIHPETGEVMSGESPTNPRVYLEGKHNFGRGGIFGQNAATTEASIGKLLKVGEVLQVLERRTEEEEEVDRGPELPALKEYYNLSAEERKGREKPRLADALANPKRQKQK